MSSGDTTRIRIGGMNCGGCVRGVARALEKAGLRAHSVEVGQALIDGSPAVEAIRAAIEGAGFQLLGIETI